MMDDPDAGHGDERQTDDALVAARQRRSELLAELERVERRIATLEAAARAAGASPSNPAAPATTIGAVPAPRAASAWDRAVQAMRRSPAPADLRLAHSAAAPAEPRQNQAGAGDLAATRPVEPPPQAVGPPPQPAAAPAPPPAAPTAARTPPSPAAAPARGVDGPSFLLAIERDARLAPNQRDALRGVYRQFVRTSQPAAPDSPVLPADEALDLDPALGRGQREAVRVLLDRFLRKTSR